MTQLLRDLSLLLEHLVAFYKVWLRYREQKELERLGSALRSFLETGDNREIEKALGSRTADQPTRHDIDGLRERPAKDRR